MAKIAEIERTPNENAMRFVLKEPLTNGTAFSFENIHEAEEDELASKLFQYSGVMNVYYFSNYITVTQDGTRDWSDLLREVAVPIREATQVEKIEQKEELDIDDERYKHIKEILDDTVMPYLMSDGGGLEIVDLQGDILKIHYQGACTSCSVSTTGTLMSIEGLLKQYYPELTVISV